MKTEQINAQSTKPNVYTVSVKKPYYIYYAHSISLYNTQQEKNDIKFLKNKHAKIVNPNGLRLGQDMFQYLYKVKECDAVWYRGNTIGVVFEVLTALSMRKQVFSLETKRMIGSYELNNLVDIFRNNDYIEHDLSLFQIYFPEYFLKFLRILKGDMP